MTAFRRTAKRRSTFVALPVVPPQPIVSTSPQVGRSMTNLARLAASWFRLGL